MKNVILAMVFSILLVSCGEKEVAKKEVVETKKEVVLEKADVSMSSPELFGGSGFGPAFFSFIKTQNFDLALKFTSKASIEKHGAKTILDKYKSLNVNYKLKQTSRSIEGDLITIRYTTNEFATSKYKDFVIIVENDSCKIVLPDNLNELLK
jgi:hypothetical protein